MRYDLTGKRFGRLQVVRHAYVKKNQNWWECKCDCGNTTIIKARQLLGEFTKSCGCYRRECKSLEPYKWMYNLIIRGNKRRKNYPDMMSFEEFKTFLVFDKCHYCGYPIKWYKNQCSKLRNKEGWGYYLDRSDNSIGYTKENCVVCCPLCNHVKGKELTHDEMLMLGPTISEIQKIRQSRLTDINSTLPDVLT